MINTLTINKGNKMIKEILPIKQYENIFYQNKNDGNFYKIHKVKDICGNLFFELECAYNLTDDIHEFIPLYLLNKDYNFFYNLPDLDTARYKDYDVGTLVFFNFDELEDEVRQGVIIRKHNWNDSISYDVLIPNSLLTVSISAKNITKAIIGKRFTFKLVGKPL
jgi:hypothetical protein